MLQRTTSTGHGLRLPTRLPLGLVLSALPSALLSALLSAGLGACSGDAATCVSELGASCQPLYQPVYSEVFTRTLQPRCALEGGSCHSLEGAKAGLIMDDMDTTYQALVDEGRVSPGDTTCSTLLVRLGGGGGGVMPPGAPLSEAERCAVEQWIRDGAVK